MEIGTKAGPYEIIDLIGRGGMGNVFLAQHDQTNELVAIKTLLKDALEEDPQLLERLKRESEALRRLNHPNIVKILDLILVDKEYAIVLEYVQGGSLLDLIRSSERLPLGFVLKISLELADALARAHHLKIIHRDLKPANILLADDGMPRLTDFGVARMETENTLTQEGMMIGSPGYMSPEMINGGVVDGRADVWSFGVVLYESLAGKRLFEGQSAVETLYKLMTAPIPKIKDIRDDIPDSLAELIDRILVRDPDERIGSIRRVGAELETIIAALPAELKEELPSGIVSRGNEPSRFMTPTPFTQTPSGRQTKANRKPSNTSTVNLFQSSSSKIGSAGSFQNPASSVQEVTRILRREQLTQPQQGQSRWIYAVVAGFGLLLLLLGGLLAVSSGGGTAEEDSTTNKTEVVIAPVPTDSYMVLVARLEPLGETQPNVDRFLLDDLRQRLEVSAASTRLIVREYPEVILSSQEAQTIALANHATIIVWGNYSPELIEVNVQAIDAEDTPQKYVQEASAVTLELTSLRTQSVAEQVLDANILWQSWYGDTFDASNALLALNESEKRSGSIAGISVGAYVHRFYSIYFSDPATAAEEIDQALTISPSNPLLFHLRSLAYYNAGISPEDEESAKTALRLSNNQWSAPMVVLSNIEFNKDNIEGAMVYLNRHLELHPDDWLLLTIRGAVRYLQGDYEAARADYESAIANDPKANFPYLYMMMIELREGNLDQVNHWLTTALQQFPDPTLGNRLMASFAGTGRNADVFGQTVASFGNLVLGQYQEATQSADVALQIRDDMPEVYMLKGVAQCLAGDYPAAEVAYTQGLAVDPELTVLYLLRADVRSRQNKLAESLTDLTAAQNTPTWDKFEETVNNAMASGSGLGCESFFAINPS